MAKTKGVTAKRDFRVTFNHHSVEIKKGEEIEQGPLADFLVETGAPVDVPRGYKTASADVEEEANE